MMNELSTPLFSPANHSVLPDAVAGWSQTDFDIAQTLAIRIRILSPSQAARVWDDAPHRLPQLVAAGLIEQYTINAHPLLKPDAPLVAWVPGQPEPNCQIASYQARARWTSESISTHVFVASRQSANLFGGNSNGLPPIEHRDHDLLLADAYAFYRDQRPEAALRWIGEDFFPKAGFQVKDPDAFLVDGAGRFRCVIESAGRYSTKQIESFHDYCALHNLPYELW